MQMIKTFFITLLLAIPFTKGFASDLKDTLSVGFDTYSDSGDVQVYSPTFSYMKTLSKEWLMGVKCRIDSISAASIKKLKSSTSSTTASASGGGENEGPDDVRFAPTFLTTYDNGSDSVTAGVYFSTEHDYQGRSIFASYVRQLNEENTALGVGVSQSFDEWQPSIVRNLSRTDRKESKVDLSINQLISPTLSMQFIYSYLYSEGFLASPYNYVTVGSTNVYELYPQTRTGSAYALKGVKLFDPANSMNFSYRYYDDNWGIKSHTLNTEWLYSVSNLLTLGLRARYYTQSKANFTKPLASVSASDTYIVSDYRMSAFDSYDVGIPLIYKPSPASNVKFSASVDYYSTTNNNYIQAWYNTSNITAFYTTFRIDYDF